MSNYELEVNKWEKLSEIMEENYDSSKMLRVHNNVAEPARLCVSEEENITNNVVGRILPQFCEIYVEPGVDLYLKVIPTRGEKSGYNVEIMEVE